MGQDLTALLLKYEQMAAKLAGLWEVESLDETVGDDDNFTFADMVADPRVGGEDELIERIDNEREARESMSAIWKACFDPVDVALIDARASGLDYPSIAALFECDEITAKRRVYGVLRRAAEVLS